MDYRKAGVDIDKGHDLLDRIKAMMGSTSAGLGHFGGAVPLRIQGIAKPLLVSSIDGVGTKAKVALIMDQLDTVGQDLVHHSINDIACCGAEPIAFLDYIAMDNMDVEKAATIISGIVTACKRWDVTLTGGESAEMPGVYIPGEFDLVGAIYGVVDESRFINGDSIRENDVILGFPSNGLHTNGYTLARKVVDTSDLDYTDQLPDGEGSIGENLLKVHTCYLSEIRQLKSNYNVKGLAHITGGGLPGNTSRIIPKGLSAKFTRDSWQPLEIFSWLRKSGAIPDADMITTLNMGIGLVAVFDPKDAIDVLNAFPDDLLKPIEIGSIISAAKQ